MSKPPLAWINAITGDVTTVDCSDTILWAPLYLASPKQEPLSEERLARLYLLSVDYDPYFFARQVEKAHGIGVDDES